MSRYRLRLSVSIAAFFAGFLLLIWFLLSTIFFRTAENSLITHKGDDARLILRTVFRLLQDQDPSEPFSPTARRFLESLAVDPAFRGVIIVGSDGRELYKSSDSPGADSFLSRSLRDGWTGIQSSADGEVLHGYESVLTAGAPPSMAGRLSFSLHEERRTMARLRQLFLAYFLLDSFLLICLGLYVSHQFMVRPLLRLLHGTQRVASGQYDHVVQASGSRELVALADSFNRMQGVLQEKEEALAANFRTLAAAHEDLKDARSETMRSEKLASVGVLAAGMGHEIGTPLSSIMGYATMLRDDLAADPPRADFATRIIAEAARIDRIVRGLLEFARPEPGIREPLDCTQVIGSVHEILSDQGFFRSISLKLQCSPGLPLVMADRSMLQQVILNLCLNARDAMTRGGILTIRATNEQDDRGGLAVRIEVEDTGDGIAAEDLARIFDPFYTTKTPGKGTGLGLAIAARIVESLGGTITAASRPGSGALFVIRLPALHGEKGAQP
jgi:signal transduction histidine kinase